MFKTLQIFMHLLRSLSTKYAESNKRPHIGAKWAEPALATLVSWARLWFGAPAMFEQYKTVQCNIKTGNKSCNEGSTQSQSQ